MAALGLAVHFDRSLCNDIAPLEELLGTRSGSTTLNEVMASMWMQPIQGNGRSRPPVPFRWARMRARILSGEFRFASMALTEFDVRTKKGLAQMELAFECFPPTAADQISSRRVLDEVVHFLYEGMFCIESAWLQDDDIVESALNAMVAFANAIDTRVAVIVAAERYSTLMALVGAGSGGESEHI